MGDEFSLGTAAEVGWLQGICGTKDSLYATFTCSHK